MVTVRGTAPTGTVTFLFSDVVGSTRLWAHDQEAMAASLRIHDSIFAETIAKFHGQIFSTAGDSFAAAFERASAAVECALEIQEALSGVSWGTWPALEVRIGLHIGEADERDGNYFGPAVNQAARVMSVAHGGQVVLTDGVRDASGIVATDLGTHQLRDIELPVHLNQLGETSFPPLTSLGIGIVSLPSPRTSLIGREDSVLEVRRLLADHRLVTLAGVGGCGKTRLSIEVAYREIPAYPDGVWFVDLSTIADAVALPGVFATALDIALSSGADPIDQIATYLAARRALLVIDNCEHVIDPVADLVDALLDRCEDLAIIATSREALEVDGEFTWKVPSLATGSDAPAVTLFLERASAAGADLVIDDQTREAVLQVVERLDGIPLAIELAAARTRSMPVTEILELLDDRFNLLSGGARRSRQRQATLEGAVQWSYDLLDDDEQSMLRVLSVFQGGFSLPDVAVVAERSDREARNLIDALVAKSLVDIVRDASGTFRYRLLETIRLFALARLIDAGEAVSVRDRHLECFSWGDEELTLSFFWTSGHVIRVGREYENFRSAITWSLERGRIEPAIRITIMCLDAAAARGEIDLAIQVLRLDAELSPTEDGIRYGNLAWALLTVSVDVVGAMEACQAARAISREHPGDYLITALYTEGGLRGVLGDLKGSQDLYLDALDIAEKSGDVNLIAGSSLFTATNEMSFLRYEAATRQLNYALAIAPDFGYRHVLEALLACSLLLEGETELAAEVASQFSLIPAGSAWSHFNLLTSILIKSHTTGADHAGQLLAAAARIEVPKRPHIGSDYLACFAYLHWLKGDQVRVNELLHSSVPFAMANLAIICSEYDVVPTTENIAELTAKRLEEHSALEALEGFNRDGARLVAEEISFWEAPAPSD